MVKDKTLCVMFSLAFLLLYISAITNNDLSMCVLANQLLIIYLLLEIINKKENK